MFVLEISCHAMTHRLFFDQRADADAAMDGLKERIGREPFGSGRNSREDETYTVVSPSCTAVVACNKVETVKVIDTEKWDEATRPVEETRFARHLEEERALALARVVPPPA